MTVEKPNNNPIVNPEEIIKDEKQVQFPSITLNEFKSWDAITPAPLGIKQRSTLTVFVVDSSMPGSNPRVLAVKGACGAILPRGKVAVVSCFESSAQTVLEPTTSVSVATKRLAKLQKSVMGNLGVGMKKGIEIVRKEAESYAKFAGGHLDSAVLIVMADSRAHGLLAASHTVGSSTGCVLDYDICDDDLVSAASDIIETTKDLASRNFHVKTIVVDTELPPPSEVADGGLSSPSDEGFRLATLSQAEYFHEPYITDDVLVRILSNVHLGPSDSAPKPPLSH